ncbi:MAG: tRNA (adenosine(37)-N6)-threonylcarbamoyltransferase complex transferase subunit TsaD [Chloroflexi bacterium]|nr:MAG: tRNA (adenosine(37)-N6)-threonylcarbamoyltransferase complex transferase subunit TsaD [Chloroflexota bacterium]
MRILAIETSCDETAAAVVADGRHILSNVVASQIELHAQYGGVFPELASRAHVEAIVPVIQQAMREAHLGFDDLDAVAVTYGPGLAGSLLVGVNAAKGLALGRDLPLIGINHLEAHIYAHWLESTFSPASGEEREDEPQVGENEGELEFPLLALIVSGGHTELILMRDHGQYEYLGGTLDDAAGEAFDKVGRLLGLAYPGGPEIQKAAHKGDPTAFNFPRAWLDNSYDFSFSGLKTAVLREIQKYTDPPQGRLLANLAASFQASVVDVLSAKTARAADEFGVTAVLLCGGVSANQSLRDVTRKRVGVPVHYSPLILCTDNAAMVGACAYRHFIAGRRAGWDLDVLPGLRLA